MYQDDSFKSINEKVYKLLVNQNDDNREIAETTDMSEEVDALINEFFKLDGFLLEFTNDIARGYNAASVQLTRIIPLMLQIKKKILDLDINNVSKSSIDSLTEYKDKYTEILNTIIEGLNRFRVQNEGEGGDDTDTFLLDQEQVESGLKDLVLAINIKLLNYNQTVSDPLTGSGYSFSLFNTSDYQPTQFLRV